MAASRQGQGLRMMDVEATSDVVESDWESESKSTWSEAPQKKSKLKELKPEEKDDIGLSLEETKAVLADYGIEVNTWSDVPKAVKTLADRWDVKPLPEVLHKPPTMSHLAKLSDSFLDADSWTSALIHMGVSFKPCRRLLFNKCGPTMKFLEVAEDWLTSKEDTGELPRTRDTVLKAMKRCRYFNEKDLEQLLEILMED